MITNATTHWRKQFDHVGHPPKKGRHKISLTFSSKLLFWVRNIVRTNSLVTHSWGRCAVVMSMYVLSPYFWSVMCAPMGTVSACCLVPSTIGPPNFLRELTVCSLVLIDYWPCGPKLLMVSQRGMHSFWKVWLFWWRFEPQTTWLASKHYNNYATLAWWYLSKYLHPDNGTCCACPIATATGKHGSALHIELVMHAPQPT